MTLTQAYAYSADFLKKSNIDEADFKAMCLACSVDGIKNSEYYFHADDLIDENLLDEMLLKLKRGIPLQYVLGKWDFYEREFYVGEGVLIPRPETEELCDMVINAAKKLTNPVIADLCAGSGCIGVSVADKIKASRVYCIEKSEKAYYYLLKNSRGISNVTTVLGDINDDFDIPFADIVVSNPPYIKTADIKNLQSEVKFEPECALDGGSDGLEFYRIINNNWAQRMKKNALLFLEIGETQGKDVKNILSNFKNITVLKDIYKNERFIIAQV